MFGKNKKNKKLDKTVVKAEKDGEVTKRLAGKHNRHKKSGSNKKYGPSQQVLHQIGLNIAQK